jgi:hypothetical protein
MQLSEHSLNNIGTIVMKSYVLESLDISWTSLTSERFIKFLENIETNRSLKYLNLSHNMLVDSKD